MSTYSPSVAKFHKAKQVQQVRNARQAQAQRQAERPAFNSLFDKSRLPSTAKYYEQQGLKLSGGGAWRDAVCPFHTDTKPSLRVRADNGAFSCMVCGAHGGDVLAFHQQRHGLTFKAAAIELGAWKGAAK
jgi:CHC2 zinc finger